MAQHVTILSMWSQHGPPDSLFPSEGTASRASKMLIFFLGCWGNPESKRRTALLPKPHGKLSRTITDYGYSVYLLLSNEKKTSADSHTTLISLQLRTTKYFLRLTLCPSIIYGNDIKQELHPFLIPEEAQVEKGETISLRSQTSPLLWAKSRALNISFP